MQSIMANANQDWKCIPDSFNNLYPVKMHVKPNTNNLSKAVEFMMSLNVSHLSIMHFDRNQLLNTNGVTHVNVTSALPGRKEWIHISKYLYRYAKYVSLFYLLSLQKGVVWKSDLPELEIWKVRIAGITRDPGFVPVTPQLKIRPESGKGIFRISSFEDDVELGKVLRKLWRSRDSFESIQFDLRGNGGGGNTVPFLITRCLAGNDRRDWMVREYAAETRVTKGKYVLERRDWDPWLPEEDSNETRILQNLNFNIRSFPSYHDPYAGNVTLIVDDECASATWWFITLMIYTFGSNVKRKSGTILGIKVKTGSFESSQLRLRGRASISGIDGNNVAVDCKGIQVKIPAQIRTKSNIRMGDFSRFWLPNDD